MGWRAACSDEGVPLRAVSTLPLILALTAAPAAAQDLDAVADSWRVQGINLEGERYTGDATISRDGDVRITIDHDEIAHRIRIETEDGLTDLLSWLGTLPLAEVRIEPLGLRAVYEKYHTTGNEDSHE